MTTATVTAALTTALSNWVGLAHLLGGYEFAAQALLALIPLFGVIGGAVASWLVAGRGVYINSITAERSKWLEKLRESISTFQAAVSTYAFRHNLPVIREEVADQSKIFEEIERTSRLASAIQLQLNPAGEVDRNILVLVRAMSIARHGSFQKPAKLDDLLPFTHNGCSRPSGRRSSGRRAACSTGRATCSTGCGVGPATARLRGAMGPWGRMSPR
jgi:hypothetical protein